MTVDTWGGDDDNRYKYKVEGQHQNETQTIQHDTNSNLTTKLLPPHTPQLHEEYGNVNVQNNQAQISINPLQVPSISTDATTTRQHGYGHDIDNAGLLFEQSPLGEILSFFIPFIRPRTIEYFLSMFDMFILFYCNWRILTTIKF